MKKSIPIAAYVLSIAFIVEAQTSEGSLHDDVVEDLCGYVESLSTAPDDYVSVRNDMAKNMKWTMMSEFADSCSTPEALCSLRDRVNRTGINDIALQAEYIRGTIAKSADLFCNGNDPKYNYSLYEVKLKAGKTVRSCISHRKGQQYFLIIPFDEGITAEIFCRGAAVPCTRLDDGSLSFVMTTPLNEDDEIKICISNNSDSNRSAVIINHNSHR